ncbi:cytochrome P450 [Macrolepiota fuliginosa MF-IS2]|uniref:Cytochrome P450 n=1 Tax=Macrolepiota fuliginosa MF-IS2 TaxID=1400762 RepID=A0A9P5XA02_9AGAR|nr:cytochrome P450 [Macrolepiota fuliginosa MF-IS2]
MPYSIGLQSAANAFVSAGFATQFTVAVIIFLLIVLVTSAFQNDAADAPTSLPGLSLSHIMPFYRRRYAFLNWGIRATGQSIFQFKLLRNTVMVVSGESGRQAFFSAKGLDLTEGFKILSGAIPSVSGVTTDLQTRRIATIHKRVAAAQREGHLSTLIPHLLEDSRKVMERWGTTGRFDPFENIYELTFQTTIRALSCGEIADDLALVSRIKKMYDKLDAGTTPVTILLPWLPSWTMVSKLWSTKGIYDIIVGAVRQRQELLETIGEGEKPQDTMQLLLDSGDDRMAVVGFIMGLLIAGARATGTSGSWLATFLASHPEWARRARSEVEELVATHTNVRFSAPSTPAPAPLSQTPVPSTQPSPWANTWPPSSAHKSSWNRLVPSIIPVTSAPEPSSSSPAPRTPTTSLPSPFPSLSPSSLLQSWTSPSTRQQRRDSQSSTVSHKRKRCNSGSDVDADQDSSVPRPRARSNGAGSGSAKLKERESSAGGGVGFPDSDGETERDMEEGRVIGGPASLQGLMLGSRRRRDAIAAGRTPGAVPAAQPVTSTPVAATTMDAKPLPQGTSAPTEPKIHSISETLKKIPLEIWESSTPVLDALIKETLRVAQPHTAMRRNLGPEFHIDGKLVPTGAYVVYPFSDVHLDQNIYEDPWKFDPGRWLDESGEKKKGEKDVPYSYIGWGGGKSPCLGTRLAKVELKLILSMFVLGFDLNVVDKNGEPKSDLPRPNWDDILLCRPPKGSFYLGFERKAGALL